MAYTITLSDEEYAALSAAAAERGTPIETLVHEALAERYAQRHSERARQATDPLITFMIQTGHVLRAPTRITDTSAERAERERLVAAAGPGKRASDIVIDDRGPH